LGKAVENRGLLKIEAAISKTKRRKKKSAGQKAGA